jgi:hypothetical protein
MKLVETAATADDDLNWTQEEGDVGTEFSQGMQKEGKFQD